MMCRGNLGQTRLAKRRRASDPMSEFDALPPDLRRWLANASLPWSPRSCLKIWRRWSARGYRPDQIWPKLNAAEARLLAKDGSGGVPIKTPNDRTKSLAQKK